MQNNTEKDYVHLSIANMLEDQLLRSVLALVQDGICFLSRDLDVLYANPAMRFWYELKGSSIGKKCYETYHGRTKPCDNCPAIRSMFSGKPEVDDNAYEKNNKRIGWQRVFCAPITGNENETVMVIEYVRDITNEKKSGATMELMHKQIQALTDIIEQKEREREEKNKLFIGNMNRSIEVVLQYLRNILDDNGYRLVENQLKMANNGADKKDVLNNLLSDQELVIARFIANGFMSKEIADELNVSKKTIDYHRTNIRKKLKLKAEANLKLAVIEYFNKTGISRM